MNRSQVRVVDPVLSTVAHGYRNAEHVGRFLMPRVNCPKSGIKLMKFGKEAFVKYHTQRAPGTKTARVQYGYSAEPVALLQDALEGVVPREWIRDAEGLPNVNQGTQAISMVLQSISLGQEIDIAALACNTATYDANHKVTLSGANMWSDDASDPKKDINTYKEAVRAEIGVYPNTLTLTPGDFLALSDHGKLKDHFKYTSPDSLTTAMLANYFQLSTVTIGKAVWTPDADSALQDVWTASVLAYVPAEAERSMGVPSFGYTYVLDEHPLVEEAYFEKNTKSWIYPVEVEHRPYLTSMPAGFLIQGAS